LPFGARSLGQFALSRGRYDIIGVSHYGVLTEARNISVMKDPFTAVETVKHNTPKISAQWIDDEIMYGPQLVPGHSRKYRHSDDCIDRKDVICHCHSPYYSLFHAAWPQSLEAIFKRALLPDSYV
jgi:hypothetical protein